MDIVVFVAIGGVTLAHRATYVPDLQINGFVLVRHLVLGIHRCRLAVYGLVAQSLPGVSGDMEGSRRRPSYPACGEAGVRGHSAVALFFGKSCRQ